MNNWTNENNRTVTATAGKTDEDRGKPLQWIFTETDNEATLSCPKCGDIVLVSYDELELSVDIIFKEWKFCPHCGVKLRDGAKE